MSLFKRIASASASIIMVFALIAAAIAGAPSVGAETMPQEQGTPSGEPGIVDVFQPSCSANGAPKSLTGMVVTCSPDGVSAMSIMLDPEYRTLSLVAEFGQLIAQVSADQYGPASGSISLNTTAMPYYERDLRGTIGMGYSVYYDGYTFTESMQINIPGLPTMYMTKLRAANATWYYLYVEGLGYVSLDIVFSQDPFGIFLSVAPNGTVFDAGQAPMPMK